MFDPTKSYLTLSPEQVDVINHRLHYLVLSADPGSVALAFLEDIRTTLRAAQVIGGEMLEDRPGWDIAALDPFAVSPVRLEPLDETVQGHAVRIGGRK